MRLHSLEISAFGPFAETSSVDFDRLSGAGLFLLSGATGAGKTSVLDAVCFALYGDVPGDRSTAKRLRADQARPGQPSRVTLEATLSGRRFRFVRSPSWERAKKRGAGTTTEQASVVVSERMKGQWVTLSTRLDEAGHLVGSLVGMNLTQFTQVAMLPQGRFQTFLRARSEDRHALLQKLFRTGRFEDVERWLRERRTLLRRAAEQAHVEIADLVSRVSEATDTAPVDGWDVHDLSGPLREGLVQAWVRDLAEACARDLESSAALVQARSADESAVRSRLEEATARAARRRRLLATRAEQHALAEQDNAHRAARERLHAGQRVAPVVGPLRSLDRARATRVAAEQQWIEAGRQVLPAADPRLDLDTAADPALVRALDDERRRATDRAAAVRALRPRELELARLRTELAPQLAHHRAAVQAEERLAERARALPDQLAAAETDVREAEQAERTLLTRRPEQRELAARLLACHQAAELTGRLAPARVALAAAREARLDRVEESQLVREARLTSMAAEIAGGLAVGSSCPVCGSCEHPHKATTGPGAVDGEQERAAQRAVVDAQTEEHLRATHLRDLEIGIATLTERAGSAEAALVQELAAVEHSLAAHDLQVRELPARRTRLVTLTREHADLVARRHQGSLDTAAHAARVEASRSAVESLAAEVTAVVQGTGHDTLQTLGKALQQQVDVSERAVAALGEVLRGREAEATADAEVRRLLGEAGFADAEEARAAVLSPEEARRLSVAVGEHERRTASVQALLTEFGQDLDPVPDEPGRDVERDERERLAALTHDHQAALAGLGEARGAVGRATDRSRRLVDLGRRLDAAVTAWRPLSDDLDLVARLSTFAEGKSVDNRLQMRLSAYVLAHRLSQVVAAANERLGAMSDQRYALEHTARRGAGESRGGLSLLVRDDWSGESRDPATLSGGETFVVSLALALGLADVITREAGGADLDTLFVDEGFGSLDAETLDHVMDTLDTLRDAGRVIGVVSHVAEMRDRIPSRLLVAKSRSGSTLTQVP